MYMNASTYVESTLPGNVLTTGLAVPDISYVTVSGAADMGGSAFTPGTYIGAFALNASAGEHIIYGRDGFTRMVLIQLTLDSRDGTLRAYATDTGSTSLGVSDMAAAWASRGSPSPIAESDSAPGLGARGLQISIEGVYCPTAIPTALPTVAPSGFLDTAPPTGRTEALACVYYTLRVYRVNWFIYKYIYMQEIVA